MIIPALALPGAIYIYRYTRSSLGLFKHISGATIPIALALTIIVALIGVIVLRSWLLYIPVYVLMQFSLTRLVYRWLQGNEPDVARDGGATLLYIMAILIATTITCVLLLSMYALRKQTPAPAPQVSDDIEYTPQSTEALQPASPLREPHTGALVLYNFDSGRHRRQEVN